MFISYLSQEHFFTKEQDVVLNTMYKLIVIQINLTVASHSKYPCGLFDFSIGILTFSFLYQLFIHVVRYRYAFNFIHVQ